MRGNKLYVRTVRLTEFDNFILGLGGDAESLYKSVGLTARSDGQGIYESWDAICELNELAAESLNEPYFGLKWAVNMPKDYRASGATLFLAHIAPDLQHFFDIGIEYQKLHNNGVEYSYETNLEDGITTGVISIHPLSVPCRQFCEHIMGGLAVMGRRYIKNFQLEHVSFQHRAPKDLRLYEDIFQCPIEFNAARNTMRINSSLLSVEKNNFATKLLRPMLNGFFTRKINKQLPKHEQSVALSVAAILPTILGARQSGIGKVAAALGLHEKKLQRLLADEGTTYSEVLNGVRKKLAWRLLLETDFSIQHIAKTLDYSSSEAFNAVCKKWFGIPPRKVRQSSKS